MSRFYVAALAACTVVFGCRSNHGLSPVLGAAANVNPAPQVEPTRNPDFRQLRLLPVPRDLDVQDTLRDLAVLRHLKSDIWGEPVVEGYAHVSIGGSSFLVGRISADHGTGLYQTAFVFVRQDGAQARLVWSALASESFSAGDQVQAAPYKIRGCLFLAADSLLAYQVSSADSAGRAALRQPQDDSLLRTPGVYRWDRGHEQFAKIEGAGAVPPAICNGD